MLHRMQAADEIELGIFQASFNSIWQVKPETNGGENLRRKVERFLPDYLLSILRLLFEAHDVVGDLDLPQVQVYFPHLFPVPYFHNV